MKITKGDVELEHFSTSSLIKITVTSQEPTEDGKTETAIQELWIDYYEFPDLKELINKINI